MYGVSLLREMLSTRPSLKKERACDTGRQYLASIVFSESLTKVSVAYSVCFSVLRNPTLESLWSGIVSSSLCSCGEFPLNVGQLLLDLSDSLAYRHYFVSYLGDLHRNPVKVLSQQLDGPSGGFV